MNKASRIIKRRTKRRNRKKLIRTIDEAIETIKASDKNENKNENENKKKMETREIKFTNFKILNLPDDLIYNVTSFMTFQDCFQLLRVDRQCNELLNSPYCWPTRLQILVPLFQNLSSLLSKLDKLKVPIIYFEWDYDIALTIAVFDKLKHMPIEEFICCREVISDKVLKEICKKPLKNLTLNDCSFFNQTWVFHECKQLTSLTELNLNNTALNPNLFNQSNFFKYKCNLSPLVGYCNITHLSLSKCNINDSWIIDICQFPLLSLDISANYIHDISLLLIKNKKIAHLNLHECCFTANGFKETWFELEFDNDDDKYKKDMMETQEEKKTNEIVKISNRLQAKITEMNGQTQRSIHTEELYDIFNFKNGGPTHVPRLADDDYFHGAGMMQHEVEFAALFEESMAAHPYTRLRF